MSDNGIASIVFLPVCTKCLNIIWQTVNCEDYMDTVRGTPITFVDKHSIRPETCPHCGRFIDSVVIPTKLPFNGSEYVEGR